MDRRGAVELTPPVGGSGFPPGYEVTETGGVALPPEGGSPQRPRFPEFRGYEEARSWVAERVSAAAGQTRAILSGAGDAQSSSILLADAQYTRDTIGYWQFRQQTQKEPMGDASLDSPIGEYWGAVAQALWSKTLSVGVKADLVGALLTIQAPGLSYNTLVHEGIGDLVHHGDSKLCGELLVRRESRHLVADSILGMQEELPEERKLDLAITACPSLASRIEPRAEGSGGLLEPYLECEVLSWAVGVMDVATESSDQGVATRATHNWDSVTGSMVRSLEVMARNLLEREGRYSRQTAVAAAGLINGIYRPQNHPAREMPNTVSRFLAEIDPIINPPVVPGDA